MYWKTLYIMSWTPKGEAPAGWVPTSVGPPANDRVRSSDGNSTPAVPGVPGPGGANMLSAPIAYGRRVNHHTVQRQRHTPPRPSLASGALCGVLPFPALWPRTRPQRASEPQQKMVVAPRHRQGGTTRRAAGRSRAGGACHVQRRSRRRRPGSGARPAGCLSRL